MPDTKNIEHQFTDDIVCPYCGEEVGDSWEISSDSDTYECGGCGKTFYYTRDVTVTYSTDKLPCANGEGPHKWWSREMRFDDGEVLLPHHYRCLRCEKETVFEGETREIFESEKG